MISLFFWSALVHAQDTPKQVTTNAPPRPWLERNLPPDQRAEMVLKELTLDEKISLVHGVETIRIPKGKSLPANYLGGAGYIVGIPRLGIPEVQSTDGRSGVCSKGGRYATALPCPLALSASWDVKLANDYGKLLGYECRASGFQISLGSTANLIREARNGRNFECLGEDPILIGKMITEQIKGVQYQGQVIANLNRYALNPQEIGRCVYNVVMDKRTMRETDLLPFEMAVKESGVGSVMGAYNRVNGTYCCENSYLLDDVLKKAWGFKGFVMSDWRGTKSTQAAALAGLDQEMPGDEFFGAALKEAVEKGQVPLARLDDMVRRVLRTEFSMNVMNREPGTMAPITVVNPFTGAEVAQAVAEQSMVLLKNADGQLPLAASSIESIVVIGSYADMGVLSGGGSDQVRPAGGLLPFRDVSKSQWWPREFQAVWQPSSPLKAIRAKALQARIQYDPGTDVAAAAKLASAAAVAIVFVHQHAHENVDQPDLSLPEKQDELVAAVAAANPHTIVVLETGGAVTMPWLGKVSAVLAAWYPGIRGGEAIANILFGDVNPSGKLTVTFPKSEADLPQPILPGSTNTFPKSNTEPFEITYHEGLKVGYKWYDAEKKEPLFPFGFGLAYTRYEYTGLKVTADQSPQVSFEVANKGARAGAEIVQVYAALPSAAGEPPKRLVAWEKVRLAPGESRIVTLKIPPLHLSVFNVEKDGWERLPGEYIFFVGSSSRNTPLQQTIQLSIAR
jgi:beta-glucosidase